jgi:SAM-dependent methyltransferase
MTNQDYWLKKHQKYIREDWISQPTIFATQVARYFPKSAKILELGAGQGQDSRYFANRDFQVLATDFSKYALDQILDPCVSKQIVDLSQVLPFAPESFDVVYSHLALHYFDSRRTRQLFDEIYAILKPGGIFAALLNTTDDPEVGDSRLIEDNLYLTPSGIQKRFFSVDILRTYISGYQIIILDNRGATHKDRIRTLIRFVGKKVTTPLSSG